MYKDGLWGRQAQERSRRRLEYFKSRHPSHPALGQKGELVAVKLLAGAELVRRPSFDVLSYGERIEVKSSSWKFRRYRNGKYTQSGWWFQVKAAQRHADSVLYICASEDKTEIVSAFLIPTEEAVLSFIGKFSEWLLQYEVTKAKGVIL